MESALKRAASDMSCYYDKQQRELVNVRFMLQPEVKTDIGVVGNR